MHESTISRNRAAKEIERNPGVPLVGKVIERGRNALEEISREMGGMLVESVFLLEREKIAGPDYRLSAAPARRGRSNEAWNKEDYCWIRALCSLPMAGNRATLRRKMVQEIRGYWFIAKTTAVIARLQKKLDAVSCAA